MEQQKLMLSQAFFSLLNKISLKCSRSSQAFQEKWDMLQERERRDTKKTSKWLRKSSKKQSEWLCENKSNKSTQITTKLTTKLKTKKKILSRAVTLLTNFDNNWSRSSIWNNLNFKRCLVKSPRVCFCLKIQKECSNHLNNSRRPAKVPRAEIFLRMRMNKI